MSDGTDSTVYAILSYVIARDMVFNATFNNILVMSWLSVLLVEETGVPAETTGLPPVTDTLYHIMLHRIHFA